MQDEGYGLICIFLNEFEKYDKIFFPNLKDHII